MPYMVEKTNKMKITILGAAESGIGAAILAKKNQADVWVSDAKEISEAFKNQLIAENIPFEENGHTKAKVLEADLIIKSPGIPEKAEIMQALRLAGKKIISEIEYASLYTNAKIIAITGSNGKTTVTSLVYHILKGAGYNVGLGGNIGQSFAYQVATQNYDWYVLEVSSFQLDDINKFRPYISVLTNITPDHLDRYEYKLEKYAASKCKIIQNQGQHNFFIYNREDAITMQTLAKYEIKVPVKHFGMKYSPPAKTYFREDKKLIYTYIDGKAAFNFGEMQLMGKHNVQNVMAAIMAAQLAGVSVPKIQALLPSFASIEHRIEKIKEINGVLYLNDSKATNTDSAFYALDAMERPVVWIAGGVDKGNDYSSLIDLAKQKVKSLIVLGPDKEKWYHSFSGIVPTIEHAMSMQEAVQLAEKQANTGDCVLLSPCCASFDLFKNYEDRGKQFKLHVNRLT